ncbi:MAG: DUF4136 domain-containing protein [Calditrichaeota bacterium]|nr:DUF4136 domain-containing protein [Calditrichota bacterium]
MQYGFKKLMLTVFLFLSGCAGSGIQYDYDRSVNFRSYITYTWADLDLSEASVESNPLLGKIIKDTINRILSTKGFTLKDYGKSDFAVFIRVASENKLEVRDWESSRGYHPWWGASGEDVTVSYYPEGSLVIDIVDISEQMLKWRGVASDIPWNKGSLNVRHHLVEAIAELFTKFPPPVQ